MDGFFPSLGNLVSRYRWIVVLVWLALFVAALPGVKNLTGVLKSGGFEVPNSEAGRGAEIQDVEFGRRADTTALLLFDSDTLTVDDPRFREAVTNSVDKVQKIEGIKDISSFYTTGNPRFVSKDRRTSYALINYEADEEKAKKLTPDIRKELENPPEGIQVFLMGFPAIAYDISQGSKHDLTKAELTSLPLTLLLLLLVFGTILAAGLPLILGAAAVLVSLAGIYLFAQRMDTSIFAMNTASMIGLGLGIDFSLLMVSRFREELDRGISPHQATINTVATSGRSIVFSGLTVMAGLSVLVLYELELIRSIALGMLLVAGVAMIGAVTLLPALLALFGRKLNAYRLIPSRKGAAAHGSAGRWHNWSLTVMSRPWLFLLLTVGILLALAYPAKDFNAIGAVGARGMPRDSDSYKAFSILLDAFGAGEASPITVLLRTPRENGAWEPESLEAVHRLVKKIEADPRVQRVDSLLSLVPPEMTEAQFKDLKPEQLQANPQAAAALPALVNIRRPTDGGNGRADTHSLVVYSIQDELNQETIGLIKDLRSDIIPSVSLPRNSETYVTGQTATVLDYRDKLFGQFPLLVGIVLLVTYVILLLFFHSLILPLKAILMNIIGILASYGVLVLVFQHGFAEDLLGFEHLGRISMLSPVILFSILFGLSTDYEVFLLSRVKELYAHTGDNDRSVAMGLERTAGTITAAGLIMIVVFGAFALGDTMVIKELGVGLAIAVLIDSTIIRIVMVPASMKLMGDLNWWMPKALDWIPHIKESAEEPEPAPVGLGYPVAAAGHEAMWPCPVCRTPLRPTARFCGRCGTRLAGAAAPAAVPAFAGAAGETVTDWRVPQGIGMGQAGRGAPQGVASGPVAAAGVRRVPIMLSNGRQQQRAWLVLRDCQVEDRNQRTGVPILQIAGVDLGSLAGSEPEIQIRNARVRL